ncbi:STAS/SEC14 domain-containing protein [Microbulbifer taiwanensis]
MEGWEPRAAWDDLKLGVKHGRQFNRIAMLGNRRWQEMAARVGSWFIGGEARYFEDETEAMAWLGEDA